MDMSMYHLSSAVGRNEERNGSANQFIGAVREMAESAANRIKTITLFEVPFPNVQRCEAILDKVCRDVERDHVQDHLHEVEIDSYVCLDLRSREVDSDTERPV